MKTLNEKQPILEFCHVSFHYDNNTRILNDISFKIEMKEIVVILGKSGNGKSTLLKLANRLLELSAGSIYYKGKDIRDISPLDLRREVGYLSQTPHLIEGTVKDNLLLPFQRQRFSGDLKKLFSETLLNVGLNEKFLLRSYRQLSVGEKQRISLARTLVNRPSVLLLDEPNAALDEENTRTLIRSLKNVIHEQPVAILVVTHQIDFAKKLGDRFLVLQNGSITEIKYPGYAFSKEE